MKLLSRENDCMLTVSESAFIPQYLFNSTTLTEGYMYTVKAVDHVAMNAHNP